MSSLKPTEAVPSSANLESNSSAQEGFSGAPGLQGHPLPITDFSAASLAEDSAPGHVDQQIGDTSPGHVDKQIGDISPGHVDKQIGDISPGHVDQEIQTEDTQAQGHVPERPSDIATHSYPQREDYTQGDYNQGAREPSTFVEREAARKFINFFKGPVMRTQCPYTSGPFCSAKARTYSIVLTI